MNKSLIFALLVVLFTACSPTQTAVISPTVPNQNPPIESTAPLPIGATPTAMSQPTATMAVTPEITGSLLFQVLSPLDDAIVNTPQVEVIGSAPAGTVVSVGDEIFLVGDDGQFRTIVMLEEGPNLIEIVASDVNGDESSLLLAVTYEP